MTHLKTAVQFLEMCALQDPKAAFEKYVHADFKHHNQYFPGDRASLMNAMVEAGKTHPNRSFKVMQIFETADRVAVVSHVIKDTMEIAVVHILRFQDGKISEMWDLGQVLDPASPNENGPF
jgi:predicted SnoaL-like aldol condensation-catalyzing enzyme